jgi:hypothetical protein
MDVVKKEVSEFTKAHTAFVEMYGALPGAGE